MRILLLLVSLLAVPAADAAVYRCTVDGKTVYTDRPCGAGAQPHGLSALSTVPAAAESDLAQDHDERREREAQVKAKEDQAWLKDHAARKQAEERTNAAIAQRKVVKDMNADQVRRSLGSPDDVERQDGGEVWIYGTGKQRRTVQFENGKVVKQTGKK